jgi:hypothetical protein
MQIQTKKLIQSNHLNMECVNHLENFWNGQNFITWLVISGDVVSNFLLRNGLISGEVVLIYHC